MRDPYRQCPSTGEFPIPQWVHGASDVGYPPIRRPFLGLLVRWGSGLTWAQTSRAHPVPVIHTGRFRRIASPPGGPGGPVFEGSMRAFNG
jgi:hypothetical protein